MLSFLKKYRLPNCGEEEMESRAKIIYTVPRQVPLFEEQDDGNLTQYENEG